MGENSDGRDYLQNTGGRSGASHALDERAMENVHAVIGKAGAIDILFSSTCREDG